MGYCNVCVEMGFHFDEIFDENAARVARKYYFEADSWSDWGSATGQGTVRPEFGYKHHADYSALLRSAALGCELCNLFAFSPKFDSERYPAKVTGRRQLCSELIDAEEGNVAHDKQLYVTTAPPPTDSTTTRKRFNGGSLKICIFCCDGIVLETGVFCYPDDEAAIRGIVGARPPYSKHVEDILSSTGTIWIESCLRLHPLCHSTLNSTLPMRVIDVGALDGSTEPFIQVNESKCPGTYVALSHCWGGSIPEMTIKHNLPDRMRCLPIKSLPRTFSDAVLITRLLGFRYLWIDSLCILQDSVEDWEIESAKMSEVYKNAVVTIAATVTPNSKAGILGPGFPQKDTYSLPLSYQGTLSKIRGTLHFRRTLFLNAVHQRVPRGPLATRAWTLQEKVLSPRTIHFGTEGLVWQCATRCESDREPLFDFLWDPFLRLTLGTEDDQEEFEESRITSSLIPSEGNMLADWYKIICDYGLRALTVSADKLPATSGIARDVAERTNFTYRAGLWEEDLHRGLLWSYDGEDIASSSAQYIAPSWSWASVVFAAVDARYQKTHPVSTLMLRRKNRFKSPYYAVVLEQLYTRQTKYDANILEVVTLPVNKSDIYGRVFSGKLTLSGSCLPATLYCEVHDNSSHTSGNVTMRRFKPACIMDVFNNTYTKEIICAMDSWTHWHDPSFDEVSDNEEMSSTDHPDKYNSQTEIDKPVRSSDSAELENDFQNPKSCTNQAIEICGYLKDSTSSSCPPPTSSRCIEERQKLRPGSIFIQISKWKTRYNRSSPLFALLLEPVGSNGEFRRRGIANIPEFDEGATRGWEQRVVTIV